MEVAVGIDIGGTNTKYSWVDRKGNILFHNSLKTTFYKEPAALVKAVCDRLKESQKEGWELKGIGVGAPNGNFYKGTIEYAPNLKWKGVIQLDKLFQKEFDVPVQITNDANASALGEMIYGDAKWMKHFIQITLGTGVGSGIVINGKLLYGHDGFAGELGHVIVNPKGRRCGCGRKGCLETYASATGIVRTLNKCLKESDTPSVLRNAVQVTSYDIFKAAEQGDELALEVFDFTAKKLGLALANVVAITSPEAIFLFGGLAKAGKLILEPTKKYMEEYMLQVFKNKVKLLPSGLHGGDAALLGSAALVWQNLSLKEVAEGH
jgi:glucokinase